MRLTKVLCKQSIGRYFNKHWLVQGKRRPVQTAAQEILQKKGYEVVSSEDILKEVPPPLENVEVISYGFKKRVHDHTHPDWHDRTLLSLEDNNVLLEGLAQAKLITRTVETQEGLPANFKLEDVSKDVHKAVKNIILNSHILDAEQQKLPIRKDPERPAWNFPRDYGVTQDRRNKLLISKLMQLIESRADRNLVKDRYLFKDLFFSFPFEKNGDLIQFRLKGDSLLTSKKPLPQLTQENLDQIELPDIYPLKETITLMEQNVYKVEDVFPINPSIAKHHPHTLFIHYNDQDVKNLFEEPVVDAQIYGRSLLKTFTVGATYARQEFGNNVKSLPKPVVLQCVHTNSNWFHFGILQINTLDLNESAKKNVWYQTGKLPLFESCKYEDGKPVLTGYNPEIIKHLVTFYNNV